MKSLFLFAFATLLASVPVWAGANLGQPVAQPVTAAPVVQPQQTTAAAPKQKVKPLQKLREKIAQASSVQKLKKMLEGSLRLAIICLVLALLFVILANLPLVGWIFYIASAIFGVLGVVFLVLWLLGNV